MWTSRSNNPRLSRKTRALFAAAIFVFAAGVLFIAAGLYTLQTDWFRQKVGEKIVSAAEQATGGRVELGSFAYDWRTLDVRFSGFIVHGSEPAGAPPLFESPSIRVGLRIVSLLKRSVDIRFLEIDRPRICLIVHSDGTTNFPRGAPGRTASDLVNQLFSLKVDRFEIKDGSAKIDAREFPVTASGDNLRLLLSYRKKAAQYNVAVSARNLQCDSARLLGRSAVLNANLRLRRNRVLVDNFALDSAGARIHIRGTLRRFENPEADFQVDAKAQAVDLAKLAGASALQGGEIAAVGSLHYDARSGAGFTGDVSGRKLQCRYAGAPIRSVDLDSHVSARAGEARFTNLLLTALGGRLRGGAVVKWNGELDLAGNFSGLSIRQAASLRGYSPSWDGSANGNLQLAGTLGKGNFALHAAAHVVPAASGPPVSGVLDLSYRQSGETLSFGDSHLDLPHTQLAFSGAARETLRLVLDSTDLAELNAALAFKNLPLPVVIANGRVHFQGTLSGAPSKPYLQGDLTAAQVRFAEMDWRQLRSHLAAAEGGVDFTAFTADSAALRLTGSGHLGLFDWQSRPASALRVAAKFEGADLARISSALLPTRSPLLERLGLGGLTSGSVNLARSLADPRGAVHLHIENLDAYGQRVNAAQIDATLENAAIRITHGQLQAGPAALSFSGSYQRDAASWLAGRIDLNADSNGFPAASLARVRRYEPGLQARIELHAKASAKISPEGVEPLKADGRMTLRNVTLNGVPLGSVELGVATRGQLMEARFTGDLRETHLNGGAQMQLAAGLPVTGEVRLDRIGLATLYALARPGRKPELPLDGFVKGGFTFNGPLEHPDRMRATVRLDQAQVDASLPAAGEQTRGAPLIFSNSGPIVINAADGVATIRSLEIQGKDTALSVRGSIPYLKTQPMALSIGGSADLRLLQLFDSSVQASGQSDLGMSLTGALSNPAINGMLRLKNGSLFLNGVANGLTAVNGALRFDRDRATLEDLTAQSGGGRLSLKGFVTYGSSGPLPGFVYRLQASAENVRLRYEGGSLTSDADLQLTGTSSNSVLSGTITVSRVALGANTDVGTLIASMAAPTPANQQDFLTGLQLDLRLVNSPNLQLNTALSRDVEAAIDLRLRGTVNHPILLGNISADQGDIKVFGAKYSINHAEVRFLNTVKIEPLLDLDLQTRARGVTVDIRIAGTPGKLNINYRSDPPLQPRDIIALLTVGRAPDTAANVPIAQSTPDVSSQQPGANTVLGAALSPASSRLQKLFGVANIKIDPMVQGITNTMQRLTIEQQISRDITVTYVTNLSQTSEQIFRLEWALSQQYSIVALRDDNGEFGIDFQYKKRFK
ncbi:MAG: translocation/assembly module TamB domain-containing protein [Acidobacteriaceae bacterium]|nr:translocation/assembly module TamB domain-containing protein [Acidobacteriaceae bacterium]